IVAAALGLTAVMMVSLQIAGRRLCLPRRKGASTENGVATDWLKILDEEIKNGNKMRKIVPKVLSNPDISLDQVKALFAELEKQAQFVEKLKTVLEGM